MTVSERRASAFYIAEGWDINIGSPNPAGVVQHSFTIGPGLTVLRSQSGEEPLRVIEKLSASPTARAPCKDSPLKANVESLFWQSPGFSGLNEVVVSHWIEECRETFKMWESELCDDLVDALELREHLGKRFEILSRGVQKKVELLGAFASGADVSLLVTPFAGLDAPSRRLVREIFEDAAGHPSRAWIVADVDWAPEFDALQGVQILLLD